MLELIKELKSKEDSYRSYVKVEVLNLLSKIMSSKEINQTTKNTLTVITVELIKIPFDYRNPHLVNQSSHDEINSLIKMALFVLESN